MDYPPVSIIISFYRRLKNVERTLQAWSGLKYPYVEFVLIDDANEDKMQVLSMVDQFKRDNPNYGVVFLRNDERGKNTNILWNWGFKESIGEFVVYCHSDVIPSTKDILQVMVENYEGRRVSVIPYYLTQTMTNIMDAVDWKTNPRLLETLPGFWTDSSVNNQSRVQAKLLTLLTGQPRKDWEWFGLFRNNQEGYLWLDQDIAIREECLKREATSVSPALACCYHQWHPGHTLSMAPGYRYKTEREARLLDPAEIVP